MSQRTRWGFDRRTGCKHRPAQLIRVSIRIPGAAVRDTKPASIDALERAIAAQMARGLDVRLVMPPVGVKDLNEWLLMGHAAREAS